MPKETFFNLEEQKKKTIIDAAKKEFTENELHKARVSNIIKEAKIPRGSFYQYFEDKMDLYKHLFDIIAAKKMEYLTEDLMNPNNLAFFDLFRELYRMCLKFAIENPDYVKISSLMMARKDLVYQEIFGSNINIAIDFYKDMILRDQKEGRMDTNIDPDILAQLVIEMTMNVTLGALELSDHIDPKVYEEKIEKVIYIFEKGIKR